MRFLNQEEVDGAEVRKYLQFHDSLNPKLWDNGELRLEVRIQLLRTAIAFYKFLEVPGLKVEDIILTGSNAAFNYTPLSDCDVHLIVDFDRSVCSDLADNFFNTKRALWNQTHQIAIRGHGVELYVEDTKNPVRANGVYSLLKGEWIKQPEPVEPSVDDFAVVAKTEQLADEIDNLVSGSPSSTDIERLIDRLKTLRKNGLDEGGEFSVENLAYKSLRNLGYLDKLWDARIRVQDKNLGLDENNR